MDQLVSSSDRPVYLRRGLLWRDDVCLPAVVAALESEGVRFEHVANEVAAFFPGLRPDGCDAIWQADADPVLTAQSLARQARLFGAAGGVLDVGSVVDVPTTTGGVSVDLDDGRSLPADVVVLAPGPGAFALLERLGVRLPLRPRLEQVVHFADRSDRDATSSHPCLYDGPRDDEPALYSMPTPGVGCKVGLDRPARDLVSADQDRTPDPGLLAAARRVRRDLTSVPVRPVDVHVCSWTDSPTAGS